jgi:hypothetical protein
MKIFLDPKIFPFISFLISLIIGLVTWGLGTRPDAAIGIAFLIELLLLTHYMLERINHIGSILGYSNGMASISKLVPILQKLSESDNRWKKILLKLRLEQFSLSISYLNNNRVPLTPDEFMEFSEILFKSLTAKDKFEAVSLFGGGEYWSRKYGQRYAALNKFASENGAKFTRTFIPRNKNNHVSLEKIYSEQSSYADIFVVDYEHIAELDKQSARDFFLLNNDMAVEFIFSADFSDVSHIDVITSDDEIKVYRKKLEKIDSLSARYRKLTS